MDQIWSTPHLILSYLVFSYVLDNDIIKFSNISKISEPHKKVENKKITVYKYAYHRSVQLNFNIRQIEKDIY